ncbi:MAG: GlsB/YeaQ/YmgE family stress response membrane protein [Candidatus Azobacteroides sp.]|nr:GlsB/YeaQ/YmgE family stress response membrane protein [Candidatus Azobacteroides sp.]
MYSWIWFIIIGIVAGFLAGLIMKGRGFGVVLNLIIGVVGSVLGGWIFNLLGISATGIIGSLICAVVGAVVLLFIVSLFKKK